MQSLTESSQVLFMVRMEILNGLLFLQRSKKASGEASEILRYCRDDYMKDRFPTYRLNMNGAEKSFQRAKTFAGIVITKALAPADADRHAEFLLANVYYKRMDREWTRGFKVVKRSAAEIFALFVNAAKKGQPEAQLWLFDRFGSGESFDDFERRFRESISAEDEAFVKAHTVSWLAEACESGFMDAIRTFKMIMELKEWKGNRLTVIGHASESDRELPPSASYHQGLRTAAGNGNAEAIMMLAECEADPVERERLYRASAAGGETASILELCEMFRDGSEVVKQNFPESLRLLRIAAAEQNADALRRLGLLHRDGHAEYGIQQDGPLALKLLRRSSKRGEKWDPDFVAQVQFELFEMQYDAKYGCQDCVEAFKCLERSADGHHHQADHTRDVWIDGFRDGVYDKQNEEIYKHWKLKQIRYAQSNIKGRSNPPKPREQAATAAGAGAGAAVAAAAAATIETPPKTALFRNGEKLTTSLLKGLEKDPTTEKKKAKMKKKKKKKK